LLCEDCAINNAVQGWPIQEIYSNERSTFPHNLHYPLSLEKQKSGTLNQFNKIVKGLQRKISMRQEFLEQKTQEFTIVFQNQIAQVKKTFSDLHKRIKEKEEFLLSRISYHYSKTNNAI